MVRDFFFTIIKKPHLEFRLSALYATWKHPNHSGKIKNVKAKKSYSILKEKNHFLKKNNNKKKKKKKIKKNNINKFL